MVLPLQHLYCPDDHKTCREFDFPVIMSGHDHHRVDEVHGEARKQADHHRRRQLQRSANLETQGLVGGAMIHALIPEDGALYRTGHTT